MIRDARSLSEGSVIDADVCIIGAGAAGITVACELRESGLKCVLLEAGGERYSSESHSIYEGESLRPFVHAHPTLYRQRRFGGSTTVWGGRCVPLEGIDFETRSWVPESGWPFPREHLNKYYQVALSYLEAGQDNFDESALVDPGPLIDGLHSDVLKTSSIERFSPPTNFAKKYKSVLAGSINVSVILNAACVELIVPPSQRAMAEVRCINSAGQDFTVRAKKFVLATGGLETPRILLSSNRNFAAGVGNSSGLVGTHYMCHIEGILATLVLRPSHRQIRWNFEITRDRVYARRRLRLADFVQKQHHLLNSIFRIHHANPANPDHRNSVLSAMYLTKRFLIPEFRRKIGMMEYADEQDAKSVERMLYLHAKNVVLGLPQLLAFSSWWFYRRHFQPRSIPYVALSSLLGRYPLEFNTEQVPERTSSIYLSGEKDRFGVPKLVIDWRMSELDVHSIVESHKLLAVEVEQSGVGHIEYLYPLRDAACHSVPVGGHHIGTTRMSSSPRDGVVDSHCRLHDVPNTYIAGSAVFPTCGHANPTLTIVALAARIAEHIRSGDNAIRITK